MVASKVTGCVKGAPQLFQDFVKGVLMGIRKGVSCVSTVINGCVKGVS